MSEGVKIESGIPIPDRRKNALAMETFAKMGPGDSVKILKSDLDRWRTASVSNRCRIAVRTLSPTECRVWLVERFPKA